MALGGVQPETVASSRSCEVATPIQPNWNPDADLDNSGSINFADLQIVKSQFFGLPGTSAGG
ncbi:MAG: hypothetical protein HKN49_10795 [Gammaproteobacteria bacterium]|nr:hypothetical protein [Gammaproteobacteria bacterium]